MIKDTLKKYCVKTELDPDYLNDSFNELIENYYTFHHMSEEDQRLVCALAQLKRWSFERCVDSVYDDKCEYARFVDFDDLGQYVVETQEVFTEISCHEDWDQVLPYLDYYKIGKDFAIENKGFTVAEIEGTIFYIED